MDVGLLGIELTTRRRNRMNAKLESVLEGGLRFSVKQSFGNCPKYIQQREGQKNPEHGDTGFRTFSSLDDDIYRIIAQADTLFIATRFNDGLNLSNRGVDEP